MYKLVLLRHGESVWNRENRFTGWTDVDLSPKGIEEARAGGRLLAGGGQVHQHFRQRHFSTGSPACCHAPIPPERVSTLV